MRDILKLYLGIVALADFSELQYAVVVRQLPQPRLSLLQSGARKDPSPATSSDDTPLMLIELPFPFPVSQIMHFHCDLRIAHSD